MNLFIFRKIRKGLLGEGAASKPASPVSGGQNLASPLEPAEAARGWRRVSGRYLIYAIGEIALVVLGILIALQINNWNEWKMDREKEDKILINITENLAMNEKLLRGHIIYLERNTQSAEIILSVIKNGEPYHDSLDYHFHKAQDNGYRFQLSYPGYEAFKNAGFDIVTNETLQKEVIALFEVIYPRLSNALGWGVEGSTWKAKYMDEQFQRTNVPGGSLKPYDFDYVVNDRYYHSMIHTFNSQRRYFLNHLNDCLSETQRVMKLINEETGTDK
jgi:hypothetical protein